MKRFMVISIIEGEQGALFFDEYDIAKLHMLDVVCGMGGLAYLYELKQGVTMSIYEFLEC